MNVIALLCNFLISQKKMIFLSPPWCPFWPEFLFPSIAFFRCSPLPLPSLSFFPHARHVLQGSSRIILPWLAGSAVRCGLLHHDPPLYQSFFRSFLTTSITALCTLLLCISIFLASQYSWKKDFLPPSSLSHSSPPLNFWDQHERTFFFG